MAPRIYRDSADWLRNGVQSGHLVSDDLDALHAIARKLDLHDRFWQGHCLTPHYQLPQHLQAEADRLGVIYLDRAAFTEMVARIGHRLTLKQHPGRTPLRPGKRGQGRPPPPASAPEQPRLL